MHTVILSLLSHDSNHREKRLLVGGDNFGRDLVGVQNLQKKHSRVEAELASHHSQLEVRETFVK